MAESFLGVSGRLVGPAAFKAVVTAVRPSSGGFDSLPLPFLGQACQAMTCVDKLRQMMSSGPSESLFGDFESQRSQCHPMTRDALK